MRKNIHPFLKETLIQIKDNGVYLKRWLYFRDFLPLEVDYSQNDNWKKSKKQTIDFFFKIDLKKVI